jgi:hypothetical protein
VIVCRHCHWAGIVEDLSFGACPECGGRKFANEFELWLRRAAWGALLGLLAYLAIRGHIL